MRLDEFLKTVVTTDEGYFCLATKEANANGPNNSNAGWREFFYDYPKETPRIISHALEAAQASNVYFSAHLFNEQRSIKAAVLPSRTIQADLDHAEVATLPVIPSVLVNTSPGRHQAYWLVDKALDSTSLETISRKIAYGIPHCDKTGWPVGHKVRLPDTYNYKYSISNKIEVTGHSLRELNLGTFDLFPDARVDLAAALSDISWLNEDLLDFDTPALELLVALKAHINPRVYSQYISLKPARDRSAALWALCCEALKAGCSRDQVLHLALSSVNNKFAERRYNGVRDLKNDILRAERAVSTKQIDLKALVMELRHLKGEHVIVKRKKIAEVVLNNMRETGEFVHCKGGMIWWLRHDTGRPIAIVAHSDWFNAYLSQSVGLNSTEQETRFVVQEVMAHCRNLPTSDDLTSLSYFDAKRGVLLLHTGGRDVWHISRDSVNVHPNGYGNVVFQWSGGYEQFRALEADDATKLKASTPWHEVLFRDVLHNTVGLTRNEAIVILRAWFLFLLFRSITTTRPILALYGQPGSGKTTTAKLFYRLVYGRYKSVSGLSDGDDFDMAVSTQPFVAFDNLDTWLQWLPDKLALCAGDSDIEKRKLYTDMDTVLLKRQALVAITAHNPKFSREDITDRLLLLLFYRLEEFKSEADILDRISNQRNALWDDIIRDVQKILVTPRPSSSEIPQFRIEDFASIGYWVSKAHSPEYAKIFYDSVSKIQGRQRSFNLEEDQTLVMAIMKYLEKRDKSKPVDFEPVSNLWLRLSLSSPDPDLFKKQYRNALNLGKKLWVMQNSLKDIFSIEWTDSRATGARIWKIDLRAAADPTGVLDA